jgi:APA family basic amino acid/polyamine antiporter
MALRRELGLVAVFAMAAGTMISSGLFILPAVLFARVGPGVSACYLLAGLLLVPALMNHAELMSAMPKAGGSYFFIDRGLGPGFGTVGGIAVWASVAFKSAFALLGIGALAAYTWGWGISGWQVRGVAAGFCIFFMGVNLLGARHAARVQIALVVVLLAVLIAYIAGSLGRLHYPPLNAYFPFGWAKLLTGAAMVFISFAGVEKVATVGEEVRRPARTLLRAMFAAAAVVGLLYVVVVFVTVGLLPKEPAGWRPAPLSQAAELMWGGAGAVALAVAAMAAFLTTGNAGILAASRVILAMGRDGLLPSPFARLSARRGTPVLAILFTSAFMVAVVLALQLEVFVKAASAMMILLFMLTMLALVLMRESRLPTYQPTWRCPFYPWTQVVGLVVYAFLLVELGTLALAVSVVILGAAVVWYALYAKVHVLRESALIRVAARLAATDFEEHDLEAELARVTRQRDEMLEDRFDHLVQGCAVLDLRAEATRGEVFGAIAERLAQTVALPAEELHGLLERREALSSTVIRPGLAIPHLVLAGASSLQIIVVRSRRDVVFAQGGPPVHCMFVIVTPPSERNLYLKVLVAIAEIAQQPDFDAKWMAARNMESLREVLLAAERRREHPRDDAVQ